MHRHYRSPTDETQDGGPQVVALQPRPSACLPPNPESRSLPAVRFHIGCQECNGAGWFSIAGGNNPYAKLYECDACGGSGLLDVEDEELEA
jgi:hypothetical protein